MAVFRIEKTRDYTVMSNYHLRDRSLSLKAKGLLSLMLSLPEDWDYTMKGLACICKDGIDSISGGIRELEAHGYLVRARVRNENGQLGSIEYTILEQPKEPAQTPAPVREKPIRENPIQVKPMLDAPIQENPAQLNTKEQNKELSITQGSSPIPPRPPTRLFRCPRQTRPDLPCIPSPGRSRCAGTCWHQLSCRHTPIPFWKSTGRRCQNSGISQLLRRRRFLKKQDLKPLPSSLAAFPASPSPPRGSEGALRMNATCGRKCAALYPSIAIFRRYAPYRRVGSCAIFSSMSRFSSSVT